MENRCHVPWSVRPGSPTDVASDSGVVMADCAPVDDDLHVFWGATSNPSTASSMVFPGQVGW